MPVIDGILTRNFPPLGRDLLDSDIIVIALSGSDITYRSTVGALRTFIGITVTGTFDPVTGEADLSAESLPNLPNVTVYDSGGLQMPVQYDNTNKKLIGGSGTFTAKFS